MTEPKHPESEPAAASADDQADPGRRKFLKAGVGVVGAGVAGVVAAPAVAYILFPLQEDVTSGGTEFVVVAKRQTFVEGKPIKVDIYADVVDAWNRMKHVRLGSCWVVETEGELVAFSTVCPHLGCAIDLEEGLPGEEAKFKCPCHRSEFTLDGARLDGPSPRDLDQLSLEVNDADGMVSVMYKRFKQGIETREEI